MVEADGSQVQSHSRMLQQMRMLLSCVQVLLVLQQMRMLLSCVQVLLVLAWLVVLVGCGLPVVLPWQGCGLPLVLPWKVSVVVVFLGDHQCVVQPSLELQPSLVALWWLCSWAAYLLEG